MELYSLMVALIGLQSRQAPSPRLEYTSMCDRGDTVLERTPALPPIQLEPHLSSEWRLRLLAEPLRPVAY